MKPNKIQTAACLLGTVFVMGNTIASYGQKPANLIPELLQEFFMNEPVFAQQKNEFQVTVKPAWRKTSSSPSSLHLPVLAEFGITDRLQVELSVPIQFNRRASQQQVHEKDHPEAGLLYSILKGNAPFALSAGLELAWSTAKQQKETGNPGNGLAWEPVLILARQFGTIQIHTHLSAEIKNRETEFMYGIAAATRLGNWLPTMEINGEGQAISTISVTPGVIWKGVDDFEFGLGLTKGNSFWVGTLMITYEFSFGRNKTSAQIHGQ